MSYENLPELLREIKQASASLALADRFDELQKAVNELFVRTGRPGAGGDGYGGDDHRSAI